MEILPSNMYNKRERFTWEGIHHVKGRVQNEAETSARDRASIASARFFCGGYRITYQGPRSTSNLQTSLSGTGDQPTLERFVVDVGMPARSVD
jgi:hypothetical protein